MVIPISHVELGPDVHKLVAEVLDSGRLAQGPMVERLEAGFQSIAQTDHAVAVSSGTASLVAALTTLDLAPGDEVITSPFTFVASVNAILAAGATVRFADIGDDFCIDPAALAHAVTERTAAVVPVHLFGLCADMAPVLTTCEAHDLALVEDAAQAHLAEYRGTRAGAFGLGCFSLYATKNLTAGEGGVVTTNDAAVADRLRVLRNQGMRSRYEFEEVGHNWRMTELSAAVAVSQLPLLDVRTRQRAVNAAALTEQLQEIDGLRLPFTPTDRRHAWHQFTVAVTDASPISRDELAQRLAADGIGSAVYYPKVAWDYDCYRTNPRIVISNTPRAAQAALQVLSLPIHPGVGPDQIDQIAAAVRRAMAG